MSMVLKIKRGLEAQLASAGVTAGELKFTTDADKQHLYIGDGTNNILLNDAYISVSTLPTANIKTDKFYYLTAVDGTHQVGIYYYDTAWHMLASEYTAGDGIAISSANVISASVDDSTIDVTATDKKLEVKDGGVTFAKLASADVRNSTDGIRAQTSAEDTKLATEKAIAKLIEDGYVAKDQGTANAGKMFVVNASGIVELTDTIDGGTF